jgi:hypothetical protein
MNAKDLVKEIVGDLPGVDTWMDGLEYGCEQSLARFPFSEDDLIKAINLAKENPVLTTEEILTQIKQR